MKIFEDLPPVQKDPVFGTLIIALMLWLMKHLLSFEDAVLFGIAILYIKNLYKKES